MAKKTHTLVDSVFASDSSVAFQNGPLLAGPAKASVTDSAILPGWADSGDPVGEMMQEYRFCPGFTLCEEKSASA